MNRTKLGLLILAALLFAVLLTLIFSERAVYLPWTMPAMPARSEVVPAGPAAAPVKAKKRAGERSAAGLKAGLMKAAGIPAKSEKKRKKRVSRLREPGEALGGGVRLDLPDKTTDMTQHKK